MSRAKRQSKILEIINSSAIETQDELVKELSNNGFKVTQATISRDIKELGIIKAATDGGNSRYVTVKSVDYIISTKLINVFKEAVVSFTTANNLVVVKTLSGCSTNVGMVVEQLNIPELVGCVSGYDTILMVTQTPEDAITLKTKLEAIVG